MGSQKSRVEHNKRALRAYLVASMKVNRLKATDEWLDNAVEDIYTIVNYTPPPGEERES